MSAWWRAGHAAATPGQRAAGRVFFDRRDRRARYLTPSEQAEIAEARDEAERDRKR